MSSLLVSSVDGIKRIEGSRVYDEAGPGGPAFLSSAGETVYAATPAAEVWRRGPASEWTMLNQRAVSDEVWSFAADPAHSGRLYLGVSPALLYRSDDEGATWTACESIKRIPGYETWTFPPPPHIPHVRSIAFNGKPDTVYIGVEEGGVYRSRDAGETWESLNEGLYWDVHTVSPAPDGDDLYATTGAGFHLSEDGGRKWEHVTRGIINRYTVPLLVSRRRGRVFTAAAAGPPPTWSAGVNGAIYRSDDAGRNWRRLEAGLPPSFPTMVGALLEDETGEVYAAAGGDIFASDDGGETWRQLSSGLGAVRSLAAV